MLDQLVCGTHPGFSDWLMDNHVTSGQWKLVLGLLQDLVEKKLAFQWGCGAGGKKAWRCCKPHLEGRSCLSVTATEIFVPDTILGTLDTAILEPRLQSHMSQ